MVEPCWTGGSSLGGTRPGKRLQKTNWKDPPFLVGKSTISMAMFNSYVKLPTMLVVDLPLWKIWKSVGMMKFPTYRKIKNGPNHQPELVGGNPKVVWKYTVLPLGSTILFELDQNVKLRLRSQYSHYHLAVTNHAADWPIMRFFGQPGEKAQSYSHEITSLQNPIPKQRIAGTETSETLFAYAPTVCFSSPMRVRTP